MQISINRNDERALYLQIVDSLRAKIDRGELPPLTRLPASRQLAHELGVNRITIVNAYAELEAEGLVKSHVGRGTFVAELPQRLPGQKQPQPWRSPVQTIPRANWNPHQMVREMMRVAQDPGLINFALGSAANDFLPVTEFRVALNEVLRRDGADALQYGDSIGYYPLRQKIAARLNEQGIPLTADDLLITDGCQQALDLVLRILGREGDAVLVENPCYLGLLDIINSHHMRPVGVPTDEYGLVVEALEPYILRYRPQLLYIVPNFQNPTGTTMPLERRRALLQLSHKYNMPVLEDTIYRELYFESPPPPDLASLDQGSSSLIFHASSYSKMLIPGLRIGYLATPPAHQERVIALKQTTNISSSPLNQRALLHYLDSGHFEHHLETVRNAYKARRDIALESAACYFPRSAHWRVPDGGLYLWVTMPPDGPTATDLYLKAVNYGVSFGIGSVFFAHNPSFHTMRLNYVACAPEDIREGMRRLGKAWHELLLKPVQPPQRSRQAVVPIL